MLLMYANQHRAPVVLERTAAPRAADIHESVPSTSQEPAPSSSHEVVLERTTAPHAADVHESVPSTSQEPAPSSSHEVTPNTSQEPDEWDSILLQLLK